VPDAVAAATIITPVELLIVRPDGGATSEMCVTAEPPLSIDGVVGEPPAPNANVSVLGV